MPSLYGDARCIPQHIVVRRYVGRHCELLQVLVQLEMISFDFFTTCFMLLKDIRRLEALVVNLCSADSLKGTCTTAQHNLGLLPQIHKL